MALSLLLSGDVSLPDMKPGSLSLSVRTLTAELHEGLFLSKLLLPVSASQTVDGDTGEEVQHIIECRRTESFVAVNPDPETIYGLESF